MNYYLLSALLCVPLCAQDSRSDAHAMRTALSGATLTEFINGLAGNVGDESSRWGDLAPMLRDNLGYQDNFHVSIADIAEPMVSLKYKKILVPAALNTAVDHEGVTPMNKYEVFKAFGREATKDDPFSYFITRPRLYSKIQKRIALGLFSPFAITTLVGIAFLMDGALTTDPDRKYKSNTAGLNCLEVGLICSFIMGNIVLETQGVEFHATKKGKQKSDAEYFALEHLTKDDLQAISTELQKKRCLPFQDWNTQHLIEAQLHKLNHEACRCDPV